MKSILKSSFVLFMIVILPGISIAQFEGVFKQRSVEIEMEALYGLISGSNENNAYLNDPGELKEIAVKVFKIPNDKLVSMIQNSEDGMISNSTTYIKKDMFRTDVETNSPMGKMSVIQRMDKKVMWTVYWDQKMYMEVSIDEMKDKMSGLNDAMSHLDDSEYNDAYQEQKMNVKKTGKSAVVNGFKCDEYLGQNDQEISLAWIASENKQLFDTFMNLQKNFEDVFPGMEDDEEEDSDSDPFAKFGFPVIMKTVNYSNFSLEEMVSLEKKSLNASDFNIPAGFKKATMQDLMKMRF